MVKFLHTADWQLGAKSLQLGTKSKEARSIRFRTVERIVKLAKSEAVDFILIAGDIFEDQDVDEYIVRRTVEILNTAIPIQVFVLPGNHDPFMSGSVWERSSWKQVKEHVHLLTERAEIEMNNGVVLYPCPLTQKQSIKDPTEWIPKDGKQSSRIRIAVAHGSLDIISKDLNFPIISDRASASNLDYLALGDWHGFMQYEKTCYSGTPEQTSYSEKNSGNIAIVTIDKHGSIPVIRKEKVGYLSWIDVNPQFSSLVDVEDFRSNITRHSDQGSLVLRVRPVYEASLSFNDYQNIGTIRKLLEDYTWYLDWPEDINEFASQDDTGLPEGLISEIDELLKKLEKGEDIDIPLSVPHSKEVASDSRKLLLRLANRR